MSTVRQPIPRAVRSYRARSPSARGIEWLLIPTQNVRGYRFAICIDFYLVAWVVVHQRAAAALAAIALLLFAVCGLLSRIGTSDGSNTVEQRSSVHFLRRATFEACLPSAVRVAFGNLLIVRLRLAAAAALPMFRRAAARCLLLATKATEPRRLRRSGGSSPDASSPWEVFLSRRLELPDPCLNRFPSAGVPRCPREP